TNRAPIAVSSLGTGTTSGTKARRGWQFTAVRRRWIARSVARRYFGLRRGISQPRRRKPRCRFISARYLSPLSGSPFGSRPVPTWPVTSRIIRRGDNTAVTGGKAKFSRQISRQPNHDPDARRTLLPRCVLPRRYRTPFRGSGYRRDDRHLGPQRRHPQPAM